MSKINRSLLNSIKEIDVEGIVLNSPTTCYNNHSYTVKTLAFTSDTDFLNFLVVNKVKTVLLYQIMGAWYRFIAFDKDENIVHGVDRS